MRMMIFLIGAGAAMAASAHFVVTASSEAGFKTKNNAEIAADGRVVYQPLERFSI